MKYTHVQQLQTPAGTLADNGLEYNGSADLSIDEEVPANGQSANAFDADIPSTGLSAIFLLSTVACVVTWTGPAVTTATLAANVMAKITTLSADITHVSIGANTTSSGPAGVLKIRALWDVTP